MSGSELVNESQGIACHLSNIHNPPPHRQLYAPVHDPTPKSIRASVLVRQCGAHPRLNVAHVPREVPAHDPICAPELPYRVGETVHGVAHVLDAVPHGPELAGLDVVSSGKLGDEGGGGAGPGEADNKSSLGEVVVAPFDGTAIGGEAVDAEGWIAGGTAGGDNEAGGGLFGVVGDEGM